jgi:choline dehydrogenase-like flavoprotein
MKHVNAVVIVGAGAGGGIVAKELAEAGFSVVVLERGKWLTAYDCRKDDLRNQRTTVLGNGAGPDDERHPRVVVELDGRERIVRASEPGYNNNAACVGGGTLTYGAMAWRFMERTSACARSTAARRARRSRTGPSPTRTWNLTTRRPSTRSASPATFRPIPSTRRAASRCPCRR